MPRGIELRDTLLKGERRIDNGRDDHLPAFHRHVNPLVHTEIRLSGDRRGQTDTQIVAPLFDIENGHSHGLLQEFCLDISLYIAALRVNQPAMQADIRLEHPSEGEALDTDAPFEPESGAYGGGHGHDDESAHGGKIHRYTE